MRALRESWKQKPCNLSLKPLLPAKADIQFFNKYRVRTAHPFLRWIPVYTGMIGEEGCFLFADAYPNFLLYFVPFVFFKGVC